MFFVFFTEKIALYLSGFDKNDFYSIDNEFFKYKLIGEWKFSRCLLT